MNNKAQLDLGELFDTEVFFEPAYWVIVALAVIGFAVGFGGAGLMSSETAYINWYVKLIILIAIFPIAYFVVKVISR